MNVNYIFSDCGNPSGKAVRIKAALSSYRFIEHCLYVDRNSEPVDENASTILKVENTIRGELIECYIEPDPDGKILGGKGYKLQDVEPFFQDIYHFLGFSEQEAKDFDKWYSRRTKVYCRERGLHTDDYPINPLVLLEISKHRDCELEVVFDYFEEYCAAYPGGHVTQEFIEYIANQHKIKKAALDPSILDAVLSAFPEKLAEYRGGKVGLLNLFFGEYLKRLTDKTIDKNLLREELTKALQ